MDIIITQGGEDYEWKDITDFKTNELIVVPEPLQSIPNKIQFVADGEVCTFTDWEQLVLVNDAPVFRGNH